MIVTLAKYGPMTAREFGEVAEYVPDSARALREDLERWGLVTTTPAVINGKAVQEVNLTLLGHRVADLARELEPVLEHARAVRVIRALEGRGPLTTRQFAEASLHTHELAKRLRDSLERAGVIAVREAVVHSTIGHRIVLTPLGRRMAEACEEIGRAVERAAKNA